MKNKKLARFLITHNEYARSGEMYIVHTRKPAFIAQIHQFINNQAGRDFLEESQPAFAIHLKRIPVVIEVVQFFDEPNETVDAVLEQMGKWFIYTKPGPADTLPASESAD